jgi:hypothetical protein
MGAKRTSNIQRSTLNAQRPMGSQAACKGSPWGLGCFRDVKERTRGPSSVVSGQLRLTETKNGRVNHRGTKSPARWMADLPPDTLSVVPGAPGSVVRCRTQAEG